MAAAIAITGTTTASAGVSQGDEQIGPLLSAATNLVSSAAEGMAPADPGSSTSVLESDALASQSGSELVAEHRAARVTSIPRPGLGEVLGSLINKLSSNSID